MLNKLLLSLTFVLVFTLSASAAFVAKAPAADAIVIDPALTEMFASDGEQITVEDFLALTPRTIREKTGERLGLKKAVALKMAQKAVKKQMASEDAPGGDKNQLVALLLAIFLGSFGIHSFYQGKTLKGIGQLVLFLGFFLIIPLILLSIWVLYDIITIAIGSQEPKNGTWNPSL